MKIVLVVFTIFVVSLCSYEGYKVSSNVSSGKQWCMDIIDEYDVNNSSIIFEEVSGTTKIKKMDPDGDWGLDTPYFSVNESGQFRCDVPEESSLGMFPAVHVYTSDNRTWERWD